MVSTYGYTTEAAIEAYANWDFSGLTIPIATATVEAIITQGEREINTKCNKVFTGTIPDCIVACAIELAYRRLYNRMITMGLMDRENPKKELMPIWDEGLLTLIGEYISKKIVPIKLHRMYTNVSGSVTY